MSDSPRFYPSGDKSQTSTPQADVHTCDPRGTSCQHMAESQDGCNVCFNQQESNTFILRTAAVKRRHTIDGMVSSGSGSGLGSVDSDNRFHPYRRQFSDSAVTAAGCLQHCSSPFSLLQEVCGPDTLTHSTSSEVPTSWDQYKASIQCLYQDLPAVPAESSCFQSHSYPSYSSASPLQQVSSRLYPTDEQSNSSKYSLQSLSTQAQKESPIHPLFPKPIYSYSILIFMALKNSKTGSLPVSEIYSFMTEHFPYFKTAPDGWKNSVRHNLSLNKCFEKVENKNGSSSRKGCLWALNPAKVEKMQEELHKWRRKDPVTVRRSMARPEDLDRLVGERPIKLRSLPPYTNPALFSRAAPFNSTTSSSHTPTQLGLPCLPIKGPQYSHIPPLSRQPCYRPPASAQPHSNLFALYSPCRQQLAADIPPATGSLNSPMAGEMSPVYSAAEVRGEYCADPRSMQELMLEGDGHYDIDMLNPSLTDLQLQGNLWDELQDSLVSDSPVVTTTTPSMTSQSSCLQATLPVSLTSEVAAIGRCKAEYKYENAGSGHLFEQHGCLNGTHPVVYSGVESLAGYLTSCTSISLM